MKVFINICHVITSPHPLRHYSSHDGVDSPKLLEELQSTANEQRQ